MKILVYIESANNKIHPVSMESLVAAQQIKKVNNAEIYGVIFNNNLSNSLTDYALDGIIVPDNDMLSSYNPLTYLEAFNQINNKYNPNLIVFGHTYETRDWVPRLSARLNIPFISDCISIESTNNTTVCRPIYQAKLVQELTLTSEKSILSFQAGSFNVENLEGGNCDTISETIDLNSVEDTIKMGEKFQESAGGVDLTAADYIVSIGRGIGKEENIPLANELANKINAQIGASRPVVDAGWLDHSIQVGSSGQTVSPKLYFALGISGAIQHLVGMKGSKQIIAINKDKNAPIFEIADYAVVGDLLEIIPKLTENL
jgi:electron transfer flavoprotein alpha subunit